MHECVSKTYTKAAEEILVLLGKNPLGNHSQYVLEILPELVETCPLAVSRYLSDREIECPWAIKQTIGNLLKADESLDFGVFSYPLIYIDEKEIE